MGKLSNSFLSGRRRRCKNNVELTWNHCTLVNAETGRFTVYLNWLFAGYLWGTRIIEADGWSHKKWFRVKVHFWKKCIKSRVSNTSFCVLSASSVEFQSGAFMHFGLFLWGLLMRLLRLLRCVRRVYRVCVCVAPGQSLERWPLSTCRWTSSCWHAELPNLYWIFSSENGPLQMTEPFHSPRQNYAILKKDARARARARAPLF